MVDRRMKLGFFGIAVGLCMRRNLAKANRMAQTESR